MADVLGRIYDSESYEKTRGETPVMINALSYQLGQVSADQSIIYAGSKQTIRGPGCPHLRGHLVRRRQGGG